MAKVIIVNTQGEFLKEEEFNLALQQGMIRQVVRVFIFRKDQSVFLQQRNGKVKIHPYCWDSSASGHVDPGETMEEAAQRELREEIGVPGVILHQIASYYHEVPTPQHTLRSYDILFVGHYDGKITLNQEEVTSGRWFLPSELEREMKQNSEIFSPGMIKAWKEYKQYQERKGTAGYIDNCAA